MKQSKKFYVSIIAIILLVSLIMATLCGCGVIKTAQAASEDMQISRAGVTPEFNTLFPLNENGNYREFSGNISLLKNQCKRYSVPTNLIGIEVPTIINPDGTINYKYETILFQDHSFNVFEYVQLTYTDDTHTTANIEYKHGEIQLFELNGSTILRIVDYPNTSILCAPLKIYSE